MPELISRATEPLADTEILSTEDSLKRIRNGWYYRYGTPEDIPFLLDTMRDEKTRSCYSAAHSILSIDATHGLDLSMEALEYMHRFQERYVREINASEDFSNHLPLFLQACYMGSPPPTEESAALLTQFPVEDTGAQMKFEVLEYIVKSGKPIEGVCAEYLLKNGGQGLLHEYVRAWQEHKGDSSQIDPVLAEATRIHIESCIPEFYTEDFELAVSTAMGFGVEIPDFIVLYAQDHPSGSLANLDSFDRKLHDLEGHEIKYPRNAEAEILEHGLSAFPEGLQEVYRKFISEGKVKSRHIPYSFPLIVKAIKEGRTIHPDVWDLMQLSDGKALAENVLKNFIYVRDVPLPIFQAALLQADRLPHDISPELAQIYGQQIRSLDAIFGVIPDDVLRIVLDTPCDIPNYLASHMEEHRKLFQLCSVYIRQRLGVSDEEYMKRWDHQLLRLVDNDLKPQIVTNFLITVCKRGNENIFEDETGALKVTAQGIDTYILALSAHNEENPAAIKRTGLLPEDILPAREFVVLYPKNRGKELLIALGIMDIHLVGHDIEMTIDEEKFGRYIKGEYPSYSLTVEGLREWVQETKKEEENTFSLDLFIKNGLLTVAGLQDLKMEDPLDFEILMQFAQNIESDTTKMAFAHHFAQRLCPDESPSDADLHELTSLLYYWIFNKFDPEEAKKLFDPRSSEFMTLDSSVRLRRAKKIMDPSVNSALLRTIFPQKELARLMSMDLTSELLEEIEQYSRFPCDEVRECFEFMLLETGGVTEYEGAHVWYHSLKKIAESMFSDKALLSRSELWQFLKNKYPLHEEKSIIMPINRQELLWEYVAEDPEAVLDYEEFTREDWKYLLSGPFFQEFLAALPTITTFDNSPLRRNAFTHSSHDKVIPFIEYLVENSEIRLTIQEFEIMKEYIQKYGLSQNDTLYKMFRWVKTKKEGESHPEFPGIESLEDIDRVLREVREQITSAQPIIQLPDDPLKRALIAHELGYTGHTFYKPDFERITAQIETTPEVVIPEGHVGFVIATQTITEEVELTTQNELSLKNLLVELQSMRSSSSTEGQWDMAHLKTKSSDILRRMLYDIESYSPHEGLKDTYIRLHEKVERLLEKVSDIMTPDDVVELFTSTEFENRYSKGLDRILREAAILQFVTKNNFTDKLPTNVTDLTTEDLDTLYRLVVSGTYNHTLALQEWANRPSQAITQDWDPKLLKPSVIRRLRKAMAPAVEIITQALESSRAESDTVDETELHCIPDRGLVGEMSAYIGHACYSRVQPLLATYPDLVPYKIVKDAPGGKEVVGSFLVFPVKLKEGKKNALLVRALNIPEGSQFEMTSIVEGIFDQMQKIQGEGGIVIIPGRMGARSEFQFIESAFKPYLTPERETSLSEKFDFNNYDLTQACHIVRG